MCMCVCMCGDHAQAHGGSWVGAQASKHGNACTGRGGGVMEGEKKKKPSANPLMQAMIPSNLMTYTP